MWQRWPKKAQFVYTTYIHHTSFFNLTPGKFIKDTYALYIIMTWVPKISKNT